MSKKRDSYLLIILIFGLIIYENYTNGVLFVLRYRNKAKEEIKQMFIALKNNKYFKAFHSRVVHCFNQVVIILRLFFSSRNVQVDITLFAEFFRLCLQADSPGN